ncbi:hypothetical protein ENUP19_0083G0055 [Entamoeba nuttalli]|uniref:Exocyst complex component 2 n=2 Tax=Entamoeba nuttalli TaxID=412467 RepID=K2GV39_ENTNP|nr:hypothetical protein ENU1_146100 [Entamoeba nuttalli P19]EKE38968.1 hypothetical protein ENU1_146100 [Entamoeba nuttalli P19]|eukprot:XP_008858705.1 hypothetical protein ENU1_146100 [Entamoeba nuttalli P19]
MEAFERLHATSWEEAKEFVDTGYVSMSQEMNAVTQAVEMEVEQGFDIIEILTESSKGKDDKIRLLQEQKELNMDDPSFSPEKYLALIHNDTSFNRLINGPLRLETKIHHKNKEIMHLVESHFDQFINCKDTLDKMQVIINSAKAEAVKNGVYLNVVIKMQEKYNELLNSLSSIKQLTDLKNRVDQSRDAISVIERARSVFSLPAQLRSAAANRDDDRFVNVFNRAQGLSKETEIGIYQDVLQDCNITAQKFVDELFCSISKIDLTRNQYDRCLTTLFEMKQFPVIILKDNPVIFLLRSHRETLKKEYENGYKLMTEKKKESQHEKFLVQSINILQTNSKYGTNTRGMSSTTRSLTTINGGNNANKTIGFSKKYQTTHKFCSKMIEHISKLIGIMQFSSNKKKKETEEDSSQLRKTTVLFEDGTVVSVSYSKNTTGTMFLDLALTTYKLTHPDLPFDSEFELCSFIGKTTEKDKAVLEKALSEAIVLGENDMPFELETRWATASKEISHSFYARAKKGVVEKESTSDRSTYVVKIIQDFCDSMTKIFDYQEQYEDIEEFSNSNNLIDKACLEDIESVLTAFTAQQISNKFSDPLKKTHAELVTSFIERITSQTRQRIINLKNSDEIYINPGNGILIAFQKLYTEDFKMLKEIIQATENPDEQVIKYFSIAIEALKELFNTASKECDEALIAQKGRENETFDDSNIEMNEYRQLTKQRKLLSLTENAQNAFSGQVLWDLYNFSSTKKEVVGENSRVKDILKGFEGISANILKYYINDRSGYFNDLMNRIDAKWYEIWIGEDIDYKVVDEYALNLITELIIIKQDLHIYAMSKESQCMSQIVLNLLKAFEEVTKKSTNEVIEKQTGEKESTIVCLRWLMGAEFIVESCKPLIQKDNETPQQIEEVLSNMKNMIGVESENTKNQRATAVLNTMNKFEALICSFKLSAAVNEEKMGKITRVRDQQRNISYLDVPMEKN